MSALRPPTALIGACLLLLLLGCSRESLEGESCSRTDDCQAPFRCIELVCVSDTPSKSQEPAVRKDPSKSSEPKTAAPPPPEIRELQIGHPITVTPKPGLDVNAYLKFQVETPGLFSLAADGAEQTRMTLHTGPSPEKATTLTAYGFSPKQEPVTLDSGTWYLKVSGRGSVTASVSRVPAPDAPPDNPAGLRPELRSPQGP